MFVYKTLWWSMDTHPCTLRWRHNGCDRVSNHPPHHCLLNRLFRGRSKKTPKLRVTGLCAGNSPETCEFPAQMASNAEKSFHLMTSSWGLGEEANVMPAVMAGSEYKRNYRDWYLCHVIWDISHGGRWLPDAVRRHGIRDHLIDAYIIYDNRLPLRCGAAQSFISSTTTSLIDDIGLS